MTADGGASPLDDDQRYAAAWRSLRTRRWVLGLLIIVGLPAVIAAIRLSPEGPIQMSVASAWMAAFVVSMVWMAGFRCPSCSRFFWWTWTRRNPFAQRCLHCKVPVGSGPRSAGAEGDGGGG